MKTEKILLTLAISLTLFALVLIVGQTRSFGGAVQGLQASIATSTLTYPVGTAQTILFATSTCVARVITTREATVMLTFNEVVGQVPTAIAGHLQLASTTVVYDSGQFGCGTFRAISATGAATNVYVSEAR